MRLLQRRGGDSRGVGRCKLAPLFGQQSFHRGSCLIVERTRKQCFETADVLTDDEGHDALPEPDPYKLPLHVRGVDSGSSQFPESELQKEVARE